jgi:hypothetical protein
MFRSQRDAGITPVFTCYMLYQSAPGNTKPESRAVMTNLQDIDTMTAYYQDLKIFFQLVGVVITPVVCMSSLICGLTFNRALT